jgi:TonB family protein
MGWLVLTPPKLHTIAVFLPAKVMVTSDKILIEGSRKTLVSPKADSYLLVGDSSAFLSIALNGAPADQVLPFLVDQLFFTNSSQAMLLIPKEYATMLPFHTDSHSSKEGEDAAFSSPFCPAGEAKAPKPIYIEPVDSPPAGPDAMATVSLAFKVDEAGHISDIWIADPASDVFDRAAVKSLLKYRFKPGTCNEVKATSPLLVNIDFTVRVIRN